MQVSSIWKKKKIYTKDSMILIHDLDGPIYYTDH